MLPFLKPPECLNIFYSAHAHDRMQVRSLTAKQIEYVIQNGEVIEEYPTDKPYPSKLILGYSNGTPIHVVMAKDDESGTCIVITAYVPDTITWNTDFKTKKK